MKDLDGKDTMSDTPAEEKKYDAILLCDGMTLMEAIRAITVMPCSAVLRMPIVASADDADKRIRLRVEYTVEDRSWMLETPPA